jgi:GMP synthase-like glutamine amidotransferase
MICYVDLEHREALRDPHSRAEHEAYCAEIKRKLERTSHVECIVRRYEEIRRDWLAANPVQALILSGNVTDWAEYGELELRELHHIIRDASLPILGLCGGLQLIGLAHGAPLGPMRLLNEGEKDPNADYAAGYLKEWGFKPVRVLQADPIFENLAAPVFLEAHYWELKEVPSGFELLATTDACRIQAIRQIGKPVYGTQFHPEAYIESPVDYRNWLLNLVYPAGYTKQQLDGRQLLEDFFRVVGVVG